MFWRAESSHGRGKSAQEGHFPCGVARWGLEALRLWRWLGRAQVPIAGGIIEGLRDWGLGRTWEISPSSSTSLLGPCN